MLHTTKKLRQGSALRGIWLCALALTVLAVVTAPLAVSRYTAQGAGTAKARVAAWEVVFAPRWRVTNNGAAITYRDLSTTWGGVSPATGGRTAWWQEFSVRNNSEVMADFILWVGYVTSDSLTPTEASPKEPNITMTRFPIETEGYNATYLSPTNDLFPTPVNNGNNTFTIKNIEPGKTAWVQLHFFSNTFDGYGGLGTRTSHKCKLFFEAVQVD